MILLNNLQSLQIVLAGAVATAQPQFYAGYVDLASGALSTPAPVTGTTNNTTAVTWVGAPAASTVRQAKYLSLYNADSASVTATVRINDNGTFRTLRVVTLLSGQSLEYVDSEGWTVLSGAQSPTPAGYIDGLRLIWVSGTALTAESGSAYVQGLARRVDSPIALAKSSLSLSASTWYHVYLFENAGVADIEIVTTAPAAAYNGTARSKTGDPSRRYIGSVKTDGSSMIFKFQMAGTRVTYLSDVTAAPFRALANGTSMSWTSFSLATVVPVTSRQAYTVLQNIDATLGVNISSGAGGTDFNYVVNPKQAIPLELPIDASQAAYYQTTGVTTSGLYADVLAYTFER